MQPRCINFEYLVRENIPLGMAWTRTPKPLDDWPYFDINGSKNLEAYLSFFRRNCVFFRVSFVHGGNGDTC